MTDSLTTYLHDHLAGSNFAVDVLEFLRDQHSGNSPGASVSALLAEVLEDRKELQGIIDRAGHSYPVLKEVAAWFGEKLSRLKLSRGDFGTFEALETLALGILGKRALWRALASIADMHSELRAVNFDRLIARAESQHAQAEELRLQSARAAFENARNE